MMGTVTLLGRGNTKQIVTFDVQTGEWRLDARTKTINGVVGLSTAEGIAIYAVDNILFFQVGRERWDVIDCGLIFHQKPIPISLRLVNRFWVTDKTRREIYGKLYFDTYWQNWENLIDWTYDDLDREMDDMYFWLARSCNDESWRQEFAAKWSAGKDIE